MAFFNEDGNEELPLKKWVEKFEPYYFIGGPTWRRRIHRGTQGSRFVEDQVCALLDHNRVPSLSIADLIPLMAWKIGMIGHRASEAAKEIVYRNSWNTRMVNRYGHNFSASITRLANEMPTILEKANSGRPQRLFDMHTELESFGPVYILTILFFVTHGKYPIYDRFAHIAAEAIDAGLPPGSPVPSAYRSLRTWEDYEHYMELLRRAFGPCPQRPETSGFIPRSVDRALWVYGHFFSERLKSPVGGAKGRPLHSTLVMHGVSCY